MNALSFAMYGVGTSAVDVENTTAAVSVNETDTHFQSEIDWVALNIFASFGILFIFVGVLGNVLTVLAVCNNPKLRKNKSSWLIANLAVSDLMFCVLCLPLNVYASRNMDKFWDIGPRICPILTYFSYAPAFTSMSCLLLITLNRYVAIVHNKYYHTLYTTRSIAVQILLAWILNYGILLLPYFELWGKFDWHGKYNQCDFSEDANNVNPIIPLLAISNNVPSVVMVICYTVIFFKVRESRLYVMSFRSGSSGTPAPNPRISRNEIKLSKTMMVTLLVLFLSYAPYSVVFIYGFEKTPLKVRYVAYLLACSAATTNFIVYAVCHPSYRKAYLELFHGSVEIYRKFSRPNSSSTSC